MKIVFYYMEYDTIYWYLQIDPNKIHVYVALRRLGRVYLSKNTLITHPLCTLTVFTHKKFQRGMDVYQDNIITYNIWYTIILLHLPILTYLSPYHPFF